MAASGGGKAAGGGIAGLLPEWSAKTPPLQLIAFGEGGGPSLTLQRDAKEQLLQAVGGRPVRAVSVCGLYRTGKSFLLNLLAGTHGSHAGRFSVGDSVRACTSGMWIRASEPAEDGSVVMLIDCEGSGSTERNKDHDARLFALAVLLSSLLVFNTRGVISDTAVQQLAVAASLAQHILRQSDNITVGRRAPTFLWVLRDFALALEDTSGNTITATEYLELILNGEGLPGSRAPAEQTGPNAGDDRREARETIMSVFHTRECATLCRPVVDEDDLQNLSELPLDKLRPKFVTQVEALREKVLRGCPVLKSPAGTPVTCSIFVSLIEAHLEAMNSGGVPEFGSAWKHVVQQECSRAVDEGLQVFLDATQGIAESLPMIAEELEQLLQKADSAAKRKFANIAVGDDEERAEFQAELDAGNQEVADRLRRQNEEASRRHNEAWLEERWADGIDAPLLEYRKQYDWGTLSSAECAKAEQLVEQRLSGIREAYNLEAMGTEVARKAALQWLERRAEAVRRELATWHAAAASRKEAQEVRLSDAQVKGKPGAKPRKTPAKPVGDQPRCCSLQ